MSYREGFSSRYSRSGRSGRSSYRSGRSGRSSRSRSYRSRSGRSRMSFQDFQAFNSRHRRAPRPMMPPPPPMMMPPPMMHPMMNPYGQSCCKRHLWWIILTITILALIGGIFLVIWLCGGDGPVGSFGLGSLSSSERNALEKSLQKRWNIFLHLCGKSGIEKKNLGNRLDGILGTASCVDFNEDGLLCWKDTRFLPSCDKEITQFVRDDSEFQKIMKAGRTKLNAISSVDKMRKGCKKLAQELAERAGAVLTKKKSNVDKIYKSYRLKLKDKSKAYIKNKESPANIKSTKSSAISGVKGASTLGEIIKIVDDFNEDVLSKTIKREKKSLEQMQKIGNRVNNSGSSGGPAGLQNYGNTCYYNSLLQCLGQTEQLARYFAGDGWKSDINNKENRGIASAWANFNKTYHQGNPNHEKLRAALESPMKSLFFANLFQRGVQQDAQQGFEKILHFLGEDLDISPSLPYAGFWEDKFRGFKSFDEKDLDNFKICHKLNSMNQISIVSKTFGFYMKQTLRFSNEKTSKYDHNTFLQLPIVADTLEKCIDEFCAGEQLSESETVQNPHGDYEAPVKSFKFVNAPEVLAIQLKRFDNQSKKIGKSVKFRETLKLKTMNGGYKYRLYAVSRHHGATLQSGHYTAHVKSLQDGEWYDANDSTVRRLSGDVTSGNAFTEAYLLFYKRD